MYSISNSIQRSKPIELRPSNLPQAGYAGLHAEATPVPVLGEALVVAHRQRSWSYEAHVPQKYIEELRKLIQAGLAQEATDGSNPRIVLELERRTGGLVEMFNLLHPSFRVNDHRSKLEDSEAPFAKTQPFLHEKSRTLRGQADEQGDSSQHRR